MPTSRADSDPASADPTEIQYRSVSGLALAALALGLLSALALVGPLLWFIPVVGIVIALLALSKIRGDSQMVGWNLALLGLLLAIFFGVAAPTRSLLRLHWLESRAELFAGHFFDLLEQGKKYAAFQLTYGNPNRKLYETDLPEDLVANEAVAKRFQDFLDLGPVQVVLANRGQATVVPLSAKWRADENGEQVVVREQITYPDAGQKKTRVAQLTLFRSASATSTDETWRLPWIAWE